MSESNNTAETVVVAGSNDGTLERRQGFTFGNDPPAEDKPKLQAQADAWCAVWEKLRSYNHGFIGQRPSGQGDAMQEIERLQDCASQLAAVKSTLREAGYVGDDPVAGIANLRALFDAARSAEPDTRLLDAAKALAERMPKGEGLRSFHAGREVLALRGAIESAQRLAETRERRACGGCGLDATGECPYCGVASCDECVNCDHKRQPETERRKDPPCDCKQYNGGVCSNCLNGAHSICKQRPKCGASETEKR